MTKINLGSDKCTTKEQCASFVDKWTTWCRDHESATLALVPISADYLDSLDRKSRAMVRKARKHYHYMAFEYNGFIDDIFSINSSTPSRQGKPMSPSYLTQPQPIMVPYELCKISHDYLWLGAFTTTGTLRGYAALAVMGDICIYNTIIGHAADKSKGAINGLIDYTVQYLLRFYPKCRYLNYLDLVNCGRGLHNFKKSVGFQSEKVQFVS